MVDLKKTIAQHMAKRAIGKMTRGSLGGVQDVKQFFTFMQTLIGTYGEELKKQGIEAKALLLTYEGKTWNGLLFREIEKEAPQGSQRGAKP